MSDIKEDLINIASKLPENATYSDAMYELYVRMKIAKGKEAVRLGKMISHEELKKRFQS